MLKISMHHSVDYFIVALDDTGKPGRTLLQGQVLTVRADDPATIMIVPDANPRSTPEDSSLMINPRAKSPVVVQVPAGTPTLGSGKVSVMKRISEIPQPNTPIPVRAHLALHDGSPVYNESGRPITDFIDTVIVVPGLEKKVGSLFAYTPEAEKETEVEAEKAKKIEADREANKQEAAKKVSV